MSQITQLPGRIYRRMVREIRFRTGSYFGCNLCGFRTTQLEHFESDGWHPHTICPRCRSQLRHRLLVAAMSELEELSFQRLAGGRTVLHFAPEDGLRTKLCQHARRYLAADFLAAGYQYQIDLQTDLADMSGVREGDIDLLIACDVLEHVPDDRRALREIFRVLQPGGWAVLTVPQKDQLEKTLEDPGITTPEGRLENYGQADHLRIYGHDFVQRLREAGYVVKAIDSSAFSPQVVKRQILFPPILSTHPLATNYRKVYFAQKPAGE